MTVGELQKIFLSSSSEARIAPEDFFVLLAHATGRDKAFLLAHPEHGLDADTEAEVREFFARRLKHEPVAYIVGRKEFYGRDFLVTPATLIPRPETEQLIELVLDKLETSNQKLVTSKKIPLVDIGTGSGNIIISLAKELESRLPVTSYQLYAVDTSHTALAVAQENARRHKIDGHISFREGSLLEPIAGELATADEIVIAANLPYLSEEIYRAADNDVKKFEPQTALVSAQAGLDHYFRLLDRIKDLQKPVTLFLEISPEQAPILKKHLAEHFPQARVSIHQDLSARDRVVEIQL